MDKNDMFVWNDKTGRIDGFVPLEETGGRKTGDIRQEPDPEKAYEAYLDDAYKEYKDDAFQDRSDGPVYSDVQAAWQMDGDGMSGSEPPGGVQRNRPPRKKRRKAPKMVTMGILCLCIVLAAVTGALSGIAVMQHYAVDTGGEQAIQIPEGTHAGLGAISATYLEASLAGGDTLGNALAEPEAADDTTVQATAANTSVIKNVMDSVVCIKTTASVNTFYGPMDASGAGSGVIISEDGYIVTCAHVVSGATKIEVQDSEDRTYEAALIASSEKMDLALLKIDAQGLTAAVLGDSDSYSPGDQIYVVGNPLGNFVLSVSQGIISGVDRQANIDGNVMRLTQVDAAVNPGNSGGGLFDSQGRLIGIVNAKNTGIDVEGMGFAIPIDTVREVLEVMLQRTNLEL